MLAITGNTAGSFQQTNSLKAPRVGTGGFAISAGLSVVSNKMAGNSMGTSVLKGIAQGAYFSFAPTLAGITSSLPMVSGAVRGIHAHNRKVTDRYNKSIRPGTNFTYRDSQAAMTMRQASVQAIQGSKLNARNALGGEASLMHRSYTR